jgi:HAMP domain-containing protein
VNIFVTWACLGTATTAVDLTMTWRRVAGRCGEPARARHAAMAGRYGSLRNAVLLGTALDFLVPPLALAGCAVSWLRDR